MIERTPPQLATWLLNKCGSPYHGDSLAGDLSEQYREGRSRVWYWKQVIAAILIARVRAIRTMPWAAVRRIVSRQLALDRVRTGAGRHRGPGLPHSFARGNNESHLWQHPHRIDGRRAYRLPSVDATRPAQAGTGGEQCLDAGIRGDRTRSRNPYLGGCRSRRLMPATCLYLSQQMTIS